MSQKNKVYIILLVIFSIFCVFMSLYYNIKALFFLIAPILSITIILCRTYAQKRDKNNK